MRTLQFVKFDKLNIFQLYQIMDLRQEVFVVEQNCPYLDADGKDLESYHLMIWDEGQLIGYARILPKGISYNSYASLGRIATKPSFRGLSLGKELVRQSITWCEILFPNINIKISAQSHLERFYEAFGFVATGDYYLEDDIPHSAMILKTK